MSRKESEKLSLKYLLNDSDYRKVGTELSEAIDGKAESEADLKSVSTQIKAKIAECDAKIQQLSSKLSCGYEYRDTECAIVYDWKKKVKVWTRVDTKETAKTAPISDDEVQEELKLQKEEKGKNGAGKEAAQS